MNVYALMQVPYEGPGCIAAWAEGNGHALKTVRLYEGEALPPLSEVGLLAVMGGPMSVHDTAKHAFLAEERAFVAEAVSAGKPVLGICLGAQLMASAFGAKVYAHDRREIGWFPVRLTERGKGSPLLKKFPESHLAFHWHGDTFDLPEGADWLFENEATPHQGFSVGRRAVGLQFHFEVMPEDVRQMLAHGAAELESHAESELTQSPEHIASLNPYSECNALMFDLLDRLVAE